jgi:CheY-like chemotaxis protein
VKKILVVDDNFDFAENLAEILRDEGYQVTPVEGGPRAIELAGQSRYDVLITDMRMPVMSGARLVHEIRRVDRGLPAIVLTAYTGENDLQAAREEGLLAVLPKPAPIERLLSLVREARRDGLVALVDDDAALADNLAEALSERGFSAVTARSVVEAERLGGVRPFVALVDLRMPGATDGEALRLVRARFPEIHVLVMSAHEDAVAHFEVPRVFVKPFETAKVIDEVEKLWR